MIRADVRYNLLCCCAALRGGTSTLISMRLAESSRARTYNQSPSAVE